MRARIRIEDGRASWLAVVLVCPEFPPDPSSRRGLGDDQSRTARAAGAKGPALEALRAGRRACGTDLASLTGTEVPTGLLTGGEGTGGRRGTVPGDRPGGRGCADRSGRRHPGGRWRRPGAASSCRRRRSSPASATAVHAAVRRRGPYARGRGHRREGPEFDFRGLRNFSESSVLARGVPEGAALATRSAIWLWHDEASSLGPVN